MGKSLLVVFAISLAAWNTQACSCIFIETFCASINSEYIEEYNVFRGKVIQKYTLMTSGGFGIPFMDVELITQYRGEAAGADTITLIGQDGVNCATGLDEFSAGTDFIFYTYGFNAFLPEEVTAQLEHIATELDGCGRSYLFVEGEQVTGPIRPGVQTAPLDEFIETLDNCIAVPTDTEEVDPLAEVVVAPNPTTEVITLFHDGLSLDQVQLYNAVGALIATDQQLIQASSGGYELPVRDLPPGLYTVVIYAEEQRRALRVVVE